MIVSPYLASLDSKDLDCNCHRPSILHLSFQMFEDNVPHVLHGPNSLTLFRAYVDVDRHSCLILSGLYRVRTTDQGLRPLDSKGTKVFADKGSSGR